MNLLNVKGYHQHLYQYAKMLAVYDAGVRLYWFFFFLICYASIPIFLWITGIFFVSIKKGVGMTNTTYTYAVAS